ncbi:MAG: sigma-70 family RNA polymerase sigma factor [Coriobacteriia bacterium]|nr:sigma-70 family RNA polymerase sigma factor [Coriobacteriia bacterium]
MNKNEFAARTEKIKKQLYRTAFVYLGSEDMALDAVGEAIYRGFMSLKKLRQAEFCETWVTRILINVCKQELRRMKREQALEDISEMATDAAGDAAEGVLDTLPLEEAINRLPQDLKDVIILRYFTDLTVAETAKSLEIPQGTVATRQRRALSLLKLKLSEEE